jgi:hypothetical protein
MILVDRPKILWEHDDPQNRQILYDLQVRVAVYHRDVRDGHVSREAKELLKLLLPMNHRRMESFPVTFAE